MTRTGLFSILLLSRLLCVAQDGATPTYAVQGTVVNSQTNQPVARAEVILNQEYAVLTGNEGRFEFDQIPAGDFQVSVRRPGYISIGNMNGPTFGRGFPRSSAPERHIRVGPNMPALTFRLVPSGAIRGQVSLSTSDPADGIRVTAYGKRKMNGLSRWEVAESATTDSDGVFHLGNLAPGDYILFTETSFDRPGIAMGGSVRWGYPAVYYPGVTDAAAAGVVTVSAGQNAEADFALTRQQFYPLTAHVRGIDSGMPAGFQILDSAGRAVGLPARYDPQEQVLRANVPSGAWILQGHSSGRERLFGQTAFQIANGSVNIGLTVLPAPRLEVTIRREFTSTDETPSATARIQSGVDVRLVDAEPLGMAGMFGSRFEPSNSSSEMTNGTIDATPGRYWVQVDTWGAYVSSVTSAGVDLAANPLVVSPNTGNAPIEVVLRNDFGTVTGQITGPAGNESGIGAASSVGEIRDTYLYAIPLFPTTSQIVATGLIVPGQIKIPQLAPGSYRVVACDSQQEIESRTPEGLAPWTGKGQVVTVEPGGTATVQLDVLHLEQQP